jgi:hypothetical protein
MSDNDLYQVTSECAYVTVDTATGPAKTLLYKGGVFKADAPECRHLVDSGMAVPFGKGGSVGLDADGALVTGGVKPAGTPNPDVKSDVKPGGDPKKPAHGDPKSDWVEYAVSRGLSREESERSSKQDLIDALK